MASQESPEEKLHRWETEGFDAVLTCSDGGIAEATLREKHKLKYDELPYTEIGQDRYPCPHDYLVAAVAGCQIEVLKRCMEKSRIESYDLRVEAQSTKIKADGDFEITATRITDIDTVIEVTVDEEDEARAYRCLELFEKNCPISRSVETGIALHTEASLADNA